MQILSVIHFLHAVNDWSAFYRDAAGVLTHKRVGCQKLDFHREVQADGLAFCPYFCHIQITVFFFHFCSCRDLFLISAAPARDVECEGVRFCCIALAGQGNVAVPWELGGDGCFYFFAFQRSAHIQVDKQSGVILGVCIGCNRTYCSCQVRRAARAAEPFLADRFYMEFPLILVACLRQYFQRVDVEEALSIECHAGQNAVVEG